MAIRSTPLEPELPAIRNYPRARPLRRLFGWGGTTCIALAAVALTSQTEAGGKRLQFALAFAREPAHTIAQIPPHDATAETRRLTAEVRELVADRERLAARIALIERNLEDMTGSIKRQSDQMAAAKTPAPTAPASPPVMAVTPPPAAAAPALVPLPMPEISQDAPSQPVTTAKPKANEQTAPPKAAEEPEPVPLPRVRVAEAPANEPAAEAPAADAEFGVDLGGASTIEALRIHWTALKANYGPLLEGLRPLAAQHPKRPTGITYRLVVGPLPNVNEAARLCARFPVTRTGCHPAKFAGVQLAAH